MSFAAAQRLAAALPPLLVEADRIAQAVMPGLHGRRRAGQGDAFWQFRRYATGDSITRIDWRQSARTDKLFVREREWEAAQTVHLWADSSGSMNFSSEKNIPTKQNTVQTLLLALAILLQKGGEKPVWLSSNGTQPLTNRAALERAATEAAMPPSRLREGLGEGFVTHPIPRHAHAILASDFLMSDDALSSLLLPYAAQSARGILLHIVDPLEESFALDGRIELWGTEGENPLLVPSAASLQSAYRQRFVEHADKLRQRAAAANWHYLRHITSTPPYGALSQLYRILAG